MGKQSGLGCVEAKVDLTRAQREVTTATDSSYCQEDTVVPFIILSYEVWLL